MDAELLTFFDEKPVDNCVYDLIDILIKNTQDLSLQGSYMELKKTLEGNNTSFAKQKRDQIRKLPEVWADYMEFLPQATVLKIWHDHAGNFQSTPDGFLKTPTSDDSILFRYRGILMEYNAKITMDSLSEDKQTEWTKIKAQVFDNKAPTWLPTAAANRRSRREELDSVLQTTQFDSVNWNITFKRAKAFAVQHRYTKEQCREMIADLASSLHPNNATWYNKQTLDDLTKHLLYLDPQDTEVQEALAPLKKLTRPLNLNLYAAMLQARDLYKSYIKTLGRDVSNASLREGDANYDEAYFNFNVHALIAFTVPQIGEIVKTKIANNKQAGKPVDFEKLLASCSNAEEAKTHLKPAQEKMLNWLPDKTQVSSVNFTTFSHPKNSKLAQMRERYLLQNGRFSSYTREDDAEEYGDRTVYSSYVKKDGQKVGAHKSQEKHTGPAGVKQNEGVQQDQPDEQGQPQETQEAQDDKTGPQNTEATGITNTNRTPAKRTGTAQEIFSTPGVPGERNEFDHLLSTKKRRGSSKVRVNDDLRKEIMGDKIKYPNWLYQLGALPSKIAEGALEETEQLNRDAGQLIKYFPEVIKEAGQDILLKMLDGTARSKSAYLMGLSNSISRRWLGALFSILFAEETTSAAIKECFRTFINDEWKAWYKKETNVYVDMETARVNAFRQYNRHANEIYNGQQSLNLDRIPSRFVRRDKSFGRDNYQNRFRRYEDDREARQYDQYRRPRSRDRQNYRPYSRERSNSGPYRRNSSQGYRDRYQDRSQSQERRRYQNRSQSQERRRYQDRSKSRDRRRSQSTDRHQSRNRSSNGYGRQNNDNRYSGRNDNRRDRSFSGNRRSFNRNRQNSEYNRSHSRDKNEYVDNRRNRSRTPRRSSERSQSRDRGTGRSTTDKHDRSSNSGKSPERNRDRRRDSSVNATKQQRSSSTEKMKNGFNCSDNYDPKKEKLCSKCGRDNHHEFACTRFKRWSPLPCTSCRGNLHHDTEECDENTRKN